MMRIFSYIFKMWSKTIRFAAACYSLISKDGAFRTKSNIYDDVFTKNSYQLSAVNYFHKKASIIDVEQGPKYAFVLLCL